MFFLGVSLSMAKSTWMGLTKIFPCPINVARYFIVTPLGPGGMTCKSLFRDPAYMRSKPPAACSCGKFSNTQFTGFFVSPRPTISSSRCSSASGVSNCSLSERQTNLRIISFLLVLVVVSDALHFTDLRGLLKLALRLPVGWKWWGNKVLNSLWNLPGPLSVTAVVTAGCDVLGELSILVVKLSAAREHPCCLSKILGHLDTVQHVVDQTLCKKVSGDFPRKSDQVIFSPPKNWH